MVEFGNIKVKRLLMKKNSIDIVFDKKNIYIGKNSSDITADILKNIEGK